MLPHHTVAGHSRFPSASSSSPPLPSPSAVSSVLRSLVQHSRYHPYTMDKRRCHYSDDSVSPSPPPTYPDSTIINSPSLPTRQDFFSALPQELIEEIGLFACSVPITDQDDHHQPFHSDRYRLHTLHSLSLISTLFHQIFTHRLYTDPLIIDTQLAPSLHLPNSATKWITSSCEKASYAKTFTLWRPRSEEMSSPVGAAYLIPLNPFVLCHRLTNIRELTFSGNFQNTERPYLPDDKNNNTSSLSPTLMPEYVPHLTSVRLLDIDDAQVLAILLVGVAHKLTSLTIHPSERGTTETYSPRSIYTTLRPVLENLISLSSLAISLPSVKFGLMKIDHCTHGCKLVHKSLSPLPAKHKLQNLSIDLPVFGCRTQFEKYDDDDDDDDDLAGGVKQVDHAFYYMALQNFLNDCPNLQQLQYKGSSVPAEIVQRLSETCPSATMTFVKAQVSTTQRTVHFNWLSFPASPSPPSGVVEPSSWEEEEHQHWPPPVPAMWRPLTDPYPEPAEVDDQQFDSERYADPSAMYNFSHLVSTTVEEPTTSNVLPSTYEFVGGINVQKPYYNDPSTWQTSSSPSDDADDEDEEEEEQEQMEEEYYDEEQHEDGGEYMYEDQGVYFRQDDDVTFTPHSPMHSNPQNHQQWDQLDDDVKFIPHSPMHPNPQNQQQWDWYVKYPDQ